MKKIFVLVVFAFIVFKCSFSQKLPDLSKWYAYKVYASGISDAQKADYLARSIEKKELAVFAAFDEKNGTGYVIIEAPYLMHEIEKYVNNLLTDFHIESNEPLTLDETLFLNSYFLRGSIPLEKQLSQLPVFINLGAKKELSNELYALAKSIWIKKYPDAYKALTPAPKPLTPEQQEKIQQKSNR
jgi:hypothetical protein